MPKAKKHNPYAVSGPPAPKSKRITNRDTPQDTRFIKAKPAPKKDHGLLGGVVHQAGKSLHRVEKNLEKVDDVQSKVTGIHAKTAAKTYADPFHKDYWEQLGGSGKSRLSTKQQAERDSFADSVMMFHGIGAAGGLARVPKGIPHPLGVAVKREARAAVSPAMGIAPRGVGGPAKKTVAKMAGPKTLDETVQEAVSGARPVRAAQEKGYSVERGKNFKAFDEAFKANPTLEGFHAAKAEHLSGALPKLELDGALRDLDQATMDLMVKKVESYPGLLPGHKLTIIKGLETAASGHPPTTGELNWIETVFGKQTADALTDPVQLSALQHAKQVGIEVLNIPRSLMASFDLSAPFRQGLVIGMRHPVIFGKNFKPMIKAFGSQRFYDNAMAEIHARPSYPRMKEAKLAITELGPLSNREEQFYSGIAEKLPPVHMSSRAYTGFLAKTRADVFDHLLERLAKEGHDINDPVFLKGLGKYVNSATGRGSLGNFEEAGQLLNTVFFSPKLMMSRLNLIYPGYYAHLPPGVRKEALRAAFQTLGTLTFMLTLASYGGAKVARDPRNADFGKIRIGNTRLDIAGGFQQPIKTLAQIATATTINSSTGKKTKLEGGFGSRDRFDVGLDFFLNKLSPPAAVAHDKLKGELFAGEPFSWKKEIGSKVTPLLWQDSRELYNDHQGGVDGITAALLGYSVGMWGVGTQTYGPPKTKTTPAKEAPFGSSTPSDSYNPFATSSGSSSYNPYSP